MHADTAARFSLHVSQVPGRLSCGGESLRIDEAADVVVLHFVSSHWLTALSLYL